MNITKRIILFIFLLFSTKILLAQTNTVTVSLLRKPIKTVEETTKVLNYFRVTKDPTTIFASGASLVKNLPAKNNEPILLNIINSSDNPLKQTFSAIILVAMDLQYEELLPLLEGALTTPDNALRAYVSAAYFLLSKDTKKIDIEDIIHLYIFDKNFARKAMTSLAPTAEDTINVLAKHSKSQNTEVRAAIALWLGNLHNEKATKVLLKIAKREQDPKVASLIATSLAKNFDFSLQEVTVGLKTTYTSSIANTYALALGFMTGNGVNAIKTSLQSKNLNVRINAIRAAAYMANVLSNEDTFEYSTDRRFDTSLLKTVIPQLILLKDSSNVDEKTYVQNTLLQLEKLI